jgi:hypothetical protein
VRLSVRWSVRKGGDPGASAASALKHLTRYTELEGVQDDGERARGWLKHSLKMEKVDVRRHFWSCVDARSTYAVLGTPGGDFGEWLLAMAAAEKLNPAHKFTMEEVNSLFQEFLYRMEGIGRHYFYLHTGPATTHTAGSALTALLTAAHCNEE